MYFIPLVCKQLERVYSYFKVSKNIQRGRDHKIGSYNEIRVKCGLKPLPKTFTASDKPVNENDKSEMLHYQLNS